MNDWNIQSRAHYCQACDKPLQDKQPYHTLLLNDARGFVRKDVCDACWHGEFCNAARDQGFISYWQGTYEQPPPTPPEAIQRETAETLLRKLIELNQLRYVAASYILAVMLERKRLLKVKEQFRRDDQRIFIYEHPDSGDLITIPDPHLQLGQLDGVQRLVAELLEFGLTAEGDIARPPHPGLTPPPSDQVAEISREDAPQPTEPLTKDEPSPVST